LQRIVGVPADHILFVDDRPKNLDAAKAVGMRTVLFDPARSATTEHPRICNLSEVLEIARD
jgi:FMN phosphatase YigB (HAD superfamily)